MDLKLRLLGLYLIIPAAFFWASAQASPTPPFRVVIDPGHGGADQGTVFQDGNLHIAEKDVTLTIAHQVAEQLRARGIQAVLTRSTDQEVPLPQRTAIANKLGADVFLSIHMNSTAAHRAPSDSGDSAEGIETYILNNASDASSKRLAHLENSVLGGSQYNGAAAGSAGGQLDVALILKDLRLDANLAESKRLACGVQHSLVSSTSRADRGVKQALFHVLLGADMPSILVEAGFLNSAKDRLLVLSSQGQRSMSTAIARAVDQFRKGKGTSQTHLILSRCKVH